MQVFVTNPDLWISAKMLDKRRANKQILECNQIYKAVIGESKGWRNHCVTRLWEDNLVGLMYFAWCCYFKLIDEGWSPAAPCAKRVNGVNVCSAASLGSQPKEAEVNFPIWVGKAMKAHLLFKDPANYSKFQWNVEPKSGYYAINKDGDWQMYSVHKEK